MKKFSLIVGLVLLAASPYAAHASALSSQPITISIPALKISAQIESRGLNSHRVMLPPTSSKNVSWYNGGVAPGQPGSAIMYGHLTDQHFRPAIFSDLHKVQIHDQVIVVDTNGGKYVYTVFKIDTFRSDSITSSQLTPPTKFSHLTLYTCAGHWVPQIHKYSQYLVVYTSLKSVIKGKS